MVYLITGKQGSGKSTYARRLMEELQQEGEKVEWLDGDVWRKQCNNNDYSDEGRYRNLMSASERATEYEVKGYIVIVSFVSPKREWRDEMRRKWMRSLVIYIPGGKLWPGTKYERPDIAEIFGVL